MIQFTKLHGNGNDFILIDEYNEKVIPDPKKSDFASKYCNRRFGIGADGVLYLERSDRADIRMRIFNSDGTEAEMCGNGIRCLVTYALGHYIEGNATVETAAGVISISSRISDKTWVNVNMGKPVFLREKIPAKGQGEFLDVNLHGYGVSAVNIGVPHAVIFVDSIVSTELMNAAPKIRYDPIFPKGANVNFLHVDSRNEITIRTYERGIEGETFSCGTGSVACAAVAHRLGKTGNKVKVNTKGGELMIYLTDDGALMEGPAERVFEGTV
jgi:diaminopimelate epimerase